MESKARERSFFRIGFDRKGFFKNRLKTVSVNVSQRGELLDAKIL